MAQEIASQVDGAASVDLAALEEPREGFRGAVLETGSKGYDEARFLWNGMIAKRPALIARCGGVGDVVESVRFASEHGLVVTVRGGGHGVAGNALCDGGWSSISRG